MNKYKKLTANTLIISIGTFGSKILSFVLIWVYSNILGLEEFSASSVVSNTIFLLVPLSTLSIDEAILRFTLDKNYDGKTVYSAGLKVAFIGNIILLAAAPLLGLIPDVKDYLWIVYLCIFASGMRMVNQQFVRARGLLRLYAVDGILTSLSLFVFSIIFMVALKQGVSGYLLSMGLADICSSLFLMTVSGAFSFIKPKSTQKNLISAMMRYSVPLIPTFILWWIVSASDLYFVSNICGDDINGLYSMAYKIPTLISIVSSIFSQAWQLSAISEFQSDDSKKFFSTVFDAYRSVIFMGSAGVLLFLIPLTGILGEEYHSSYIYSPLLVAAVVISCFCQFLGSIYSASKNTKNSLWTSAVAATANILLNIALIPKFGAHGAAFATMFSYSLCFIIRIIDTRKLIAYKVDWFKLLLNFSALLCMCIAIMINVKFLYAYLVFGCLTIALLNIQEIIQTVFKILKK